eukprot:5901059-Lingulodinium_polyedra.AAC.1
MLRSFLLQAAAPKSLWLEAALHACAVLNRTPREDGATPAAAEELEAQKASGCTSTPAPATAPGPESWPPWGCKAIALRPKAHREDKLEPVAIVGVFVGFDPVTVNGVRVAVPGPTRAEPVLDVIVSTTVRTKDDQFPFVTGFTPNGDELQEIVYRRAEMQNDVERTEDEEKGDQSEPATESAGSQLHPEIVRKRAAEAGAF